MYPTLFTVHGFEITSFGLLVALAAVTAFQVFQREAAQAGLPPAAADAALAGILGGMLGAKVIWAIEFSGTAPFPSLLFSRSGLSWFGGFVGGIGAGLWMLRARRVPIMAALSAAAPALAIGHAIGRVGCFLVGDDYGRPSDLPWAVAFPEGRPPTLVAVHPTQLYEALALTVVAVVLIRMRRRSTPDARVFGTYLLLAGSIRFAIEFVRINAKVIGPFTLAQAFAAAAVLVGVLCVRYARGIRSTPRSAAV